MKRIKIMSNHNEKSKLIEQILREKLSERNFKIVEENCEIMIAIGGDGSFLRMIRASNFNEEILFVGINAGTLGFAQEVEIEEMDEFLKELETQKYQTEEIAVQETQIIAKDKVFHHNSLNEIVIRDKNLNTLNMEILVEGTLLEKFAGDGILVTTSFGSTAYNLSFGGSIVDKSFHTLQITPIAPLNNKSYKNLRNSVILPIHKKITLIPENESIIVSVDGENYDYQKVDRIETFIQDKKVLCLRRNNSNFAKKINEKFLQ